MITIGGNEYYSIDETLEYLTAYTELTRCNARSTLYTYFRKYGTPASITLPPISSEGRLLT